MYLEVDFVFHPQNHGVDHSDSIHMHIKKIKKLFYVGVRKKRFLLYEQRGQKVCNYKIFLTHLIREASKKNSALNGRAIKEGGCKGLAIKEKNNFFFRFLKKLFCHSK